MDTNISLVDHKYGDSSNNYAPTTYEPPALGIPGQNINLIPQTGGNIAIGIPGIPENSAYAPPPPAPAPAAPASQAFCGPLSLEYYMPYFDVTTDDVKQRAIAPFFSNREDFFYKLQGKPDLWGPFWVYTTLIFFVGAGGNLANWLNWDTTISTFHFDYSAYPAAAGLIYGIGTIFPIILNFLLGQMTDMKTDFIQAICLYGYTAGIWIPVAVAASLPFGLLQWVVLLYGTVATSMFVIMNYWKELVKLPENRKYFFIGCIVTTQLIFLLTFKLKFFGLATQEIPNNHNANIQPIEKPTEPVKPVDPKPINPAGGN